jgi:hypothetical protein
VLTGSSRSPAGGSPRTNEVADELRSLGVDAYPVRADLADYDAVEALWQTVTELPRGRDRSPMTSTALLPGATDSDFHAPCPDG